MVRALMVCGVLALGIVAVVGCGGGGEKQGDQSACEKCKAAGADHMCAECQKSHWAEASKKCEACKKNGDGMMCDACQKAMTHASECAQCKKDGKECDACKKAHAK
jgi:hypothetical protein